MTSVDQHNLRVASMNMALRSNRGLDAYSIERLSGARVTVTAVKISIVAGAWFRERTQTQTGTGDLQIGPSR